jgi:spore coat polysaccharide biosynthesis predicted glycosyltransferase SpsG
MLIRGDETTRDWLANTGCGFMDWLKEENRFFSFVSGADVVIVDSYLAGPEFYQKISHSIKAPVYIDDEKRLVYPRGFIVNGSIYAGELGYPENQEIVYLLGARHALLRKEFWSPSEDRTNESIETILVTLGGEDIRGLMSGILKMLNSGYPKLKKRMIIGRGFKNIGDIEKEKDSNTEMIYYPNADMMKRQMSLADVAISSGGQTIYELARIGLPTIGVCLADNQVNNLSAWEKAGFLESAGWYNDGGLLDNIKNILGKMDYARRSRMSRIGKTNCDGQGAIRVVDRVLGEFN